MTIALLFIVPLLALCFYFKFRCPYCLLLGGSEELGGMKWCKQCGKRF